MPAHTAFARRLLVTPIALGLWLALATAVAAAEADGAVAAWSFDTVHGRLVPDESGHANDGLVTAGTLVSGVAGTAVQFGGLLGSVRVADAESLRPAEALTVTAWVRLDGPVAGEGAYANVIRKEKSYALRFHNGGLGLALWTGGQIAYLESAAKDWPVDRWFHLAGTYDGARMRLYVNGVEDKASPRAQTGRLDADPAPCYIGACAGQYALKGTVDEVRVFGRALTADEVSAAWRRGQQSLAAQAGRAPVAPRAIGVPDMAFRSPVREATMVQDGFLWVEAEAFADYGGWLLDTQFVHLMGSAYLLASGVGQPVRDAVTEVAVPRAGTWRVWVRARNWLPEHSPGTFTVTVNGRESAHVFGRAASDQWLWESAGDYPLEAGRVRLGLHDRSGYYGRCEALLLTTDLAYVPPAKLEDVQAERSRLTGLTREPTLVGEYDVIVVGAGAAGCCAALAAARGGARTALIQNRPVLGGNASSEMGVPLNGASVSHPNARESGVVEEIGRVQARYGYSKISEAAALLMEQEKGLSVFLNRHVIAVDMADKTRIAGVRAVDTLTGAMTQYRGRLFIDCTGDGWVGYYAGATFRLGREARSEFNEDQAPEQEDTVTMSGCIMGPGALGFRAESQGHPVSYAPPPWAHKLPAAAEFGRHIRSPRGGEWWLEHPGDIDDLWDAERARDELIRITYGYWDFIKNAWPERAQAADFALVTVPITDAKRETRRLVGDYMLTQNDIQKATLFPDRVSYGGWPIDVHNAKGIFSGREGPFHCDPPAPLYSIPYRCLYSVNIDNLLFAGRCMSVTHIALGSVRVQSTLATLGQVAGTAAAMALQRNTTPRGLGREHIADLQQTLLRDDLYIPGLKNEDARDLARTAKVTASSTADHQTFGLAQALLDSDLHPLNMNRAVLFPTGAGSRLGSVALRLASERPDAVTVQLHLRGAPASGDYSAATDLAVATGTVPPGRESWVDFRFDRTLADPFAWVWLPKTEGVSWRLLETAPAGSGRAYGGDAAAVGMTVVKGQYYAFATTPPLALPVQCEPGNATNGVTRIVDGTLNLWCSAPGQPLPQWLELAWEKPVTLDTVYLTFDTDLNVRLCNVPLVPQCVRDYEVSVATADGWKTVARVAGNFQRRRVHAFEPVSTARLRLTVLATNGVPDARVFEVRAHHAAGDR